MLLFLADLPLNGSAYTVASGVNAAALRAYHYALFVRSVYDYFIPILIVGGLLCNIVSIVVLGNNNAGGGGGEGDHTTSSSSSSSSLHVEDSYDTYLSSRAVADAIFLLCLLVVWLDTVGVPLYTTAGWCQGVTYVSLVTSFMSVWSTVVASVDRSSVLCRGGRTSFSSRTKARFVCLGLLWFALPVYLNISILIDVAETYVGPVCAELHDYYDTMQVINRIETVVNVVIPWIIISIASVMSLVRLLYTPRCLNQSTSESQLTVDYEVQHIRSTTIAQLWASLVFVVLGLPADVHQLSVMLAGNQSAPVGLETYMTQRLLLVVLYSRCSSTFFVHFAANRCFRRRLMAMLLGFVRRRPACCERGRSAAAAAGDISLSLAPTWSHGARNDRPTTGGNSRDCVAAVATTSVKTE